MNAIAVHRRLCAARDRLFSLAVGRSFAACGPGTVVHLPVRVVREDRIWLGRDVTIGPACWLVVLRAGGRLEIGDRTAMTGNCIVAAAERVTIGANVLIASGVFVADAGHDHSRPGVPIRDAGLRPIAPVTIGDGAWIGENAVILPGVSIGAGAVVGANSVVRDDVPAGSVAVGAPARILAHRTP
jgi:UDP-3-O-[3-hydroxymyristoyl] glucosamine N-acyltransferase